MLRIVPTTLREANAYVAEHHRHHKPVRGCISVCAVASDAGVHGVAILSRPVARMLQDGLTAEITRCCTDGTPNACSMLYGALRRAAKALGYRLVITYTLPCEGGSSLKAAGFCLAARTSGGSWSRPSRLREDDHPLDDKWRWEALLGLP